MLLIIDTLIDLASQVSNKVALQLAQAHRDSKESHDKKDFLVNYRHAYIVTLQAAMAIGVSMQQHRNNQYYLQNLDRDIDRQNEICLADQAKVLEQQNLWKQSEHKRLSYVTLSNRAISIVKKLEDKREQKATDEFASRKYASALRKS